jgi:membrane protein
MYSEGFDMSNLEKLSNNYETASRNISYKFVSQLLQGFFLFKNRKGGIVAGSTTFFVILSFCPALLLMISLLGYLTGDIIQAKAIVLETMNSNMPGLAPWIFKSITAIIDSQLSASTGNKILNIVVLGYSLLGVVSSMEFGLNTIHNRKSKGGFLLEDIKSIFVGFSLSLFLGSLLILTNKSLVNLFVFSKFANLREYDFLLTYQILPTILSLTFFTLFYKLTAKKEVTIKNAFFGAAAFVTCFVAGKSFYWVYVNMAKDDLAQSYGNFYTLIIAVMWVYFLISSFLYSASVASLGAKDMAHRDVDLSIKGNILPFQSKVPEIPKISA